MDIVFATDAAGVAESLCGQVDGGDNVSLGFAFGLRRTNPPQCVCGVHRPRPGAEILCGEVASGDSLQVGVPFFRVDFLLPAFVVMELDYFFAADRLTALNEA